MAHNDYQSVDVVLVGAGIMSATLGVLLKELNPGITLEVVELRESGAVESSNPWNNAGTGHAALCELNYTPEGADGSIDIKKSVTINAQFEESKQFWAYLIEKGAIKSPKTFINPVPHMSFVRGNSGIAFLKKRFEALRQHHAFTEMEYTEDRATIAEWAPLLIPGRDASEPLAMTRVQAGTDVNFGAVTEQMLDYLTSQPNAKVICNQKVTDLKRDGEGWLVDIKDTRSGATRKLKSKFVFLGAGGGALPLLQLSGIPEGKGFGGFPVSGQFLRCTDESVVNQHMAKVYGQAAVGAPPMSVPHLDTRFVNGKRSLLFGPYAGFSTNFLKTGSYLDLPLSVRPHNLSTMLDVAKDNMDLTKYLVTEVLKSRDKKIDALHEFYPEADGGEWELITAGQRVQVMKRKGRFGGVLQFGTEVVTHADGSLGGLLGASPGASTAAPIMVKLLERCFPAKMAGWDGTLKELIPSLGHTLNDDPALLDEVRTVTDAALKLA